MVAMFSPTELANHFIVKFGISAYMTYMIKPKIEIKLVTKAFSCENKICCFSSLHYYVSLNFFK